MKNFVLVGAAGYIAPRHFLAIKETGNNLLAAMDVNDSVGVIDQHFPNADFFLNFDQLEKFIERQWLDSTSIDYMVVCSPNYLHIEHIKFALMRQIDVVCEKPLVLSVEDLNQIQGYEKSYGARVNTVLQLRLHPSIVSMKKQVMNAHKSDKFDVELTYLTSRGKWYFSSWKGSVDKSGGLVANIGVHFFDMLGFVFGELLKSEVHFRSDMTCSGYSEYTSARVRWFLSVDTNHLPSQIASLNKTTYRSLKIDGQTIEFSDGFTDLHTESYKKILSGDGYGSETNRLAISAIEDVRNSKPVVVVENTHSLLLRVL